MEASSQGKRGERSSRPHPPWQRTPFVGREKELSNLRAQLEAAKRGDGTVVLLSGEPGIGKTRLLREVSARANADGWRVLTGHAYDTEGMPPYLPFIEALEGYVHDCPADDLKTQLGDGATDVAMLVREVGRRIPELPAVSASPSPSERYHLFESICQFLLAIGSVSPSGLLLCLDDLHWADPSTLLLCQHLARRISRERILVLGAYRGEEADHSPALLDFLAELARDSNEHRITLSRLSAEETANLAADLTGVIPAPVVARAIFDQTQGNAFFVGEVVRQLRDSGADLSDIRLATTEWQVSEGVRQVVGKRLLHLQPETRQLLEGASVLGERFSAELLPVPPGLITDVVTASLEEATAAGMLQEEGDGYRFGHPLIRRVVYEQLRVPRRRSLHLAAAETMESVFSEDIQTQLSALAYHFHLAAPSNHDKALDYASRAGDRAAEVFAYEEAARMYQLAIEALQSGGGIASDDLLADLRLKRARALAAITKWAEARREFEAALPLLRPERVTECADLLTDLAIACLWTSETTVGKRYAAEATTLAESGLQDDILTAAIAATARLQFSNGEIEASVQSYQKAIERSHGRRIFRLDQLTPGYAHLLYLTGDHQAAIQVALECIEVSRRSNDFSSLVYAQEDLALSLAACGRYDDALAVLNEAQSVGREHGLTTFLARAYGMMTGPYFDLFNYERALLLAEEARDFGRSVEWKSTVVSAGIDLLFCSVQIGEVGKAEALLDDVAAEAAGAADIHGWLWKLRLAQARAQIALARRDWREAIDLASASSELSRDKKRTKYEVAASVTRGQALVGLGRKRDAVDELHHAVQIARPVGDPAMMLRASAAILSIEPNATVAAEARSAVDLILKGLSRTEMLRTFEESEPVRRVLSFQKDRRGPSLHPKALSDRKIEVLGLIVQGKTNREIAEALVLSERTVQRHIADLYGAIDVRNRAEATAFGINQLGLPSA